MPTHNKKLQSPPETNLSRMVAEQNAKQQSKLFWDTRAPSNPYQQMIENENAKQQSKLFWDTNVPQTAPQQPPSELPLDVVMHNQQGQ